MPAGPFTMGTSTEAWALDNERPAHQVEVEAFYLDTTPVTNGAVPAVHRRRRLRRARGGGARPGWAHRQQAGLVAPLFWTRDGDGSWWRRRFGTESRWPHDEPVVHVCCHEAAGLRRVGRPPAAHRGGVGEGGPLGSGHRPLPALPVGRRRTRRPSGPTSASGTCARRRSAATRPVRRPRRAPADRRRVGVDVLELRRYPGFEVFPYAEYSQVFFGEDYQVLRGGSFGTDRAACRGTFRNWDYPIRRQIFAGFRTARDAGPG